MENPQNKELGQKLEIKATPTFLLYRDNQQIASLRGAKVLLLFMPCVSTDNERKLCFFWEEWFLIIQALYSRVLVVKHIIQVIFDGHFFEYVVY